MNNALIVCGQNVSKELIVSSSKDAFLVGADKGCIALLDALGHGDLAVGDFDSTSDEQLRRIHEGFRAVEILNPVKDDTDTAHALHMLSGFSRITILGGIQGKRPEHLLANIDLIRGDGRVELLDDNSRIFSLFSSKNAHILPKDGYRFCSIFALEPSILSLRGFKYPLEKYRLMPGDPLGVSNEILGEEGEVLLTQGRILVILSKADS